MIDIAYRVDTRRRCFETLGIHINSLAIDVEAPLGNRPKLRCQAVEHQRMVRLYLISQQTFLVIDNELLQCAVLMLQLSNLRILNNRHFAGLLKISHRGNRRIHGAVFIASMHQRNVLRYRCQSNDPVECRIAAAEDGELLARVLLRVAHPVLNGSVAEFLDALRAQCTRLERTDTCSDHDSLAVELFACIGLYVKFVTVRAHNRHFFAEVHARAEGFDLLKQAFGQFVTGAHRDTGNVVDGFVRIELRTLAARLPNRVNDLGLEAQQSELENLKQAARPGADDDNVRFDQWIGPKKKWRRERDSNPRRAFNPYSLSRGALSTTQPSLRSAGQSDDGPKAPHIVLSV